MRKRPGEHGLFTAIQIERRDRLSDRPGFDNL
jgi:hypothetical protein